MQRFRGTVFLVLISIALPALMSCSFPASFVIMNRSEGLMEVVYEFKDSPGVRFSCPEGNIYSSPSVRSAEDIEDREAAWAPLGPGEYVCDPVARRVHVPVGSGVALKVVEHDDPGTELGALDSRRFPIESLLINGTSGSMEFRGAQVLRAFTRGETGLTFHITYQ